MARHKEHFVQSQVSPKMAGMSQHDPSGPAVKPEAPRVSRNSAARYVSTTQPKGHDPQ